MTVSEIKNKTLRRLTRESFRKQIDFHCANGLKQFKKIVHSHLFFHFFFISLLAAEAITFLFFLIFFFKPSLIAFSLAALLLTGFSYLILIFYFQTKKPEQLLELRNWFMLLCKKEMPSHLTSSDYHLSLASAAYSFATYLSQKQSQFYTFSKISRSFNQLTKRLMHLCHRRDIHKMKEILILVSINEHIQLIKKQPTDVEAHASLANAYVALSHLYRTPEGQNPSKEFSEKFKTATSKAVQEFEIINYYSPNDPWVYAQMASCYHDLKLYEKEIKAYETILKLCPNDKEVLFRLGILYFQQELNAQGLKIYEKLKELNFSRTQELIDFYGSNIKQEYYTRSL